MRSGGGGKGGAVVSQIGKKTFEEKILEVKLYFLSVMRFGFYVQLWSEMEWIRPLKNISRSDSRKKPGSNFIPPSVFIEL